MTSAAERLSGLPMGRVCAGSSAAAYQRAMSRIASAPSALHAHLRGQKPAETLAALTAAGPTRDRAALLGRARTSKLASGLAHSFRLYAHQEFGTDWTGSGSQDAWLDQDVWASSTFHVERWEGVRVDTRTARVLVRGEDLGTSWGGTPKRDKWGQYKLILRRDPTAP